MVRSARRKELLRRLTARAAEDTPAAEGTGLVGPPGATPHPSLLDAVRDATAAEADARPAAGEPTVRALLREATDRKRAALWAWDHDDAHPDGVPPADPAPDGGPDGGADGAAEGGPDASWRHELAAFARASRGVQERLGAADDRLLDRVIPGTDASVAEMALELAAFDAYCAGRAVQLRAGSDARRASSGPHAVNHAQDASDADER